MNAVSEILYPSLTGLGDIYAKLWMPKDKPTAILQIAHGVAEHIERYTDFANFLNMHGILVAGNDHAGHGKSLHVESNRGYYGRCNGWSSLVGDIKALKEILNAEYPNLPYIMLGHSMGSFLMRSFASRFGGDVVAFIFSGTSGKNPALGLGKFIAKLEALFKEPNSPSKLLDKLSFGTYNKKFAPSRTNFDWLSRDTEMVDLYVSDELCGFVNPVEGMLAMFQGLEEITGKSWAGKVPDIPILLISGQQDPVGGYGKGVHEVCGWLKETGHNRITCKLYPGGRHEMLNETNRAEVYEDILGFIKETIGDKYFIGGQHGNNDIS